RGRTPAGVHAAVAGPPVDPVRGEHPAIRASPGDHEGGAAADQGAGPRGPRSLQLGGRPAAVCLRDPRPLASHGQGPCGDDRGFSRRAGETVRPVVAGERLRAEVIDGRRSPDRRGTSRTADRAVHAGTDRRGATRRLLNEKVQAQVEIRSDRPIVVTMRPGAVKAMGPARGMMTVTEVPVTLDPSSIRETFVRLERPQVQDIDLSTADIIVSAGRGI